MLMIDEKQKISVNIRWMISRDAPEVLHIENESFEFPWHKEDFIECLSQSNCKGIAAENEKGQVIGFMIYKLYSDVIHLLNFAVVRAYRRRSVGSQMIAKLFTMLSAQKRTKIVLEVRETNLAAQLFFRENGFRAIKVLHNYYKDAHEDAYKMRYIYRADKSKVLTPEEISANRISRIAE